VSRLTENWNLEHPSIVKEHWMHIAAARTGAGRISACCVPKILLSLSKVERSLSKS